MFIMHPDQIAQRIVEPNQAPSLAQPIDTVAHFGMAPVALATVGVENSRAGEEIEGSGKEVLHTTHTGNKVHRVSPGPNRPKARSTEENLAVYLETKLLW